MEEGGNGQASSASSCEGSGVNALVTRGRTFALPTEWEAPPGDPLHHQTASSAKILCSAVFVTALDADLAAENIGYFTSDYDQRAILTKREVDMERKEVRLTL